MPATETFTSLRRHFLSHSRERLCKKNFKELFKLERKRFYTTHSNLNVTLFNVRLRCEYLNGFSFRGARSFVLLWRDHQNFNVTRFSSPWILGEELRGRMNGRHFEIFSLEVWGEALDDRVRADLKFWLDLARGRCKAPKRTAAIRNFILFRSFFYK